MQSIKNVCLVETVYSLFLYMLLTEEHEINNTYFFTSNKLPKSIKQKLQYKHDFRLPSNRFHKLIFRCYLRLTSTFRWPFLRRASLFGGDCYLFSSGIIGSKEFVLIEDGYSNYTHHNYELVKNIQFYIKHLLLGPISAYGSGGFSPNIKKIILTGLLPIPKGIQSKVEVISIFELWNNLSDDHKKFIISFFDITDNDIMVLSNYSSILFTQPLFEDNLVSYEDKIILYKDLMKDCDDHSLLIKVHPRDTYNYKVIFPNARIFNKNVPMELLSLLGIKFNDVYTIFSTAALSLPYKTRIHMSGTSAHPNLEKLRGKMDNSIICNKFSL